MEIRPHNVRSMIELGDVQGQTIGIRSFEYSLDTYVELGNLGRGTERWYQVINSNIYISTGWTEQNGLENLKGVSFQEPPRAFFEFSVLP